MTFKHLWNPVLATQCTETCHTSLACESWKGFGKAKQNTMNLWLWSKQCKSVLVSIDLNSKHMHHDDKNPTLRQSQFFPYSTEPTHMSLRRVKIYDFAVTIYRKQLCNNKMHWSIWASSQRTVEQWNEWISTVTSAKVLQIKSIS